MMMFWFSRQQCGRQAACMKSWKKRIENIEVQCAINRSPWSPHGITTPVGDERAAGGPSVAKRA